MTEAEVMRRLRALMAMPEAERPVSIYRLEKLAGIADGMLYRVVHENRKLQARTVTKLARALTMVEQDRVAYRKRYHKGSELILSPPKPPCITVSRIRIGKDGPKIERVAINPNAFPVLPLINKKV